MGVKGLDYQDLKTIYSMILIKDYLTNFRKE